MNTKLSLNLKQDMKKDRLNSWNNDISQQLGSNSQLIQFAFLITDISKCVNKKNT